MAKHQSGIGSATVDLNYGAFFDRFQKNALPEQKVLRPSSMPEANAMGIADDGKTFGVPAANTMTFSERGRRDLASNAQISFSRKRR